MRGTTIWIMILVFVGVIGGAVRPAGAEGESLAGLINDLRNLRPSTTDSLSSGLGFQKGDCAAIDPRLLANERVLDNPQGSPASEFAVGKGFGLAGHFGSPLGDQPQRSIAMYRFSSRQHALDYIAKCGKGYMTGWLVENAKEEQKFPDTYRIKFQSRWTEEEYFNLQARAYLKAVKKDPGHVFLFSMVLYRDTFIIQIDAREPTFDYDLAAGHASILEKCRKLIDLRFPPEKR